MSFKSREKKRKRQGRRSSISRHVHRDTMAGRHYLTIVSRTCSCNECGRSAAGRRRVRLPQPTAGDHLQALRRQARTRPAYLDALGAREGEAEEETKEDDDQGRCQS